MQTPCVQICELKNGVCIGCLRSVHQIANWMSYSADERSEIITNLENQLFNELVE